MFSSIFIQDFSLDRTPSAERALDDHIKAEAAGAGLDRTSSVIIGSPDAQTKVEHAGEVGVDESVGR